MDSNKRPDNMVRITTKELADAFIEEQINAIREQVGDKKVLLALSGGVDSSVVAALLIKAIGKQLVCVHVNHGLMRKGESENVIEVFRNGLDANLVYVDATDRFLGKLENVSDPESKRKIIGAEFINVFDEEAAKLDGAGRFTVFWKITLPMARPLLPFLRIITVPEPRRFPFYGVWLENRSLPISKLALPMYQNTATMPRQWPGQ